MVTEYVEASGDISHHPYCHGNLHNSVSACAVGRSLLLIRSAEGFHSVSMVCCLEVVYCKQFLLFSLSDESVCGEKIEMHQRVETKFELCGQLRPR